MAFLRKRSDFMLGFLGVCTGANALSGLIDTGTVSMSPNPVAHGVTLLVVLAINLVAFACVLQVLIERMQKR